MSNDTFTIKPIFRNIDHIAIAVRDLDAAIDFFTRVLRFELIRRRTINGRLTGMVSAEFEHNAIRFVLCQGIEPASQICKLIDAWGPGVAHIALAVDDINAVSHQLKEQGLAFDTTIIKGPGLKQVFSSRDENSGLSFELIERSGEQGFLDGSIEELFAQLENAGGK